MQNKSTAYWAALTGLGANWRYGLDLLASDEVQPLEDTNAYDLNATDRLVPSQAKVDLDTGATTQRSFSFQLRNTDGRYLPGAAGYPSGGVGSPTATGLTWFNVRYRPWMDLQTGFNSKGNPIWDRTYIGVYTLLNPEAQVKNAGSMMQLNLLDKSALLQKPYLITNSTIPTFVKNGHTVGGYASGSTFDSVMSDLAVRAGVPAKKQVFEPSTLTLPADYSIQELTEWWTHLATLAGSMAHIIYFDANGNLVRRADPMLLNPPSVYTFASDATSIHWEIDRKTDLQQTYNHVVVIGGSSKTGTVRGEAQISNPASPYHKNQIGDRVVPVGKDGKLNDQTPDPTIGTTAQANARAQQILARMIGQLETITIKGRNIPPLEPYDRITIRNSMAGLAMDVSVDKITWNFDHGSSGGMQLDCSRWFIDGAQ